MRKKEKRGRPPVVITRPIDLDALDKEVKKARRERDPRYLERLYALRYFAAGKSREQVAKLVGRGSTTILQWMKLWNEGGFPLLRPEFNTTRPSKISSTQIEALKNDLRKKPTEFGYLQGGWSVKLIFHHLKVVYGIVYHSHSWYRCLKTWGITAKVPRTYNARQDPAQVELYWTETIPKVIKKKKS